MRAAVVVAALALSACAAKPEVEPKAAEPIFIPNTEVRTPVVDDSDDQFLAKLADLEPWRGRPDGAENVEQRRVALTTQGEKACVISYMEKSLVAAANELYRSVPGLTQPEAVSVMMAAREVYC